MATARKNVERIVTVVETVNLTLSIHEAEALRSVIDMVAGSSVTSPRKHTDAIGVALANAGVRYDVADNPFSALSDKRKHAARLIDKRHVGQGIRFGSYPSDWTEDDRG